MEEDTPPRSTALKSWVHTNTRHLWEACSDALAIFLICMVAWMREIPAEPTAIILLALVAGCVMIRRQLTLMSAACSTILVSIAGFAWPGWDTYTIVMFTLAQLCLLSVALRCSRRSALIVAVVLGGVLYAQGIYANAQNTVDLRGLLYLTWTAAVLGAGLAVRTQRDYVESLEARHRASEAERHKEVARHLTQERLRIARDLHDSVAHNISVITVHAGSAERTMHTAPEAATSSLAAIRDASRTVLTEMQQILKVLRDEDSSERVVPGMAAVPLLLATLRASGLQIWYQAEHEDLEVSPTVDLTIYRFLQEALTNASKYSDGTAHVTITKEDTCIRATVKNRRNPSAGPRPSATSGGFGLIGMKERVGSAGGHLSVVQDGIDFSVAAAFPTTSTRGTSRD